MHGIPVQKIGTQNEGPGDLALNARTGVQGRGSFVIGRKDSAPSRLLGQLNSLNPKVCVGEVAGETTADGRNNREEIGAGKQGGTSAEIERGADRNVRDAWQYIAQR